MRSYKVACRQFLPIDKFRAWEFFSSPKNLGKITPARMNFKILSISGGDKMHKGQIIRYKVTVLPLVRLHWETEITEVVDYETFTDVQVKGPYRKWIHKHTFREVDGGVEMEDEVEYALPFGIFGPLINFLVVAREVQGIFDYRSQVLNQLFNTKSSR